MKYTKLLLITICSLMMSCSENDYTLTEAHEEIDHQKEYLQFIPVKWEADLIEKIDTDRHWLRFSSNLLTYENLVILPLNHDGIAALDQETGNLVWQTNSQDGELLEGYGIELIGDVLLCNGFYSAIALNPLDGSILWEQQYERSIGNDHLIETNGDLLYKIFEDEEGHYHIDEANVADGEWERIYSGEDGVELNFGFVSNAFSVDGTDYLVFETIVDNSSTNEVRTMNLLNLANGSVIWSDTFISSYSTTNKIFVSNNQIIHYNNERNHSNVRALSIDNGEELWKVNVPSYHLPFPYVLNGFLYLNSVDKINRIDLSSGMFQDVERISMGYTDMTERDGKIYYAGFYHDEDHSTTTGIGSKIAVVDKETIQLDRTILPHHRNNTTMNNEPYGVEVFDNAYSYVGREMVFSQNGKYIFVSGHNEVLCLQLESEAAVILHSKL